MLVHTAIPIKWKEDLEVVEEIPENVKIIAEKSPKLTKSKYLPRISPVAIETPKTHNHHLHQMLKRKWEDKNIQEVVIDNNASTEIPNPVIEEEHLEAIESQPSLPPKDHKKSTFIILKPNKMKQNISPSIVRNYIKIPETQKEEENFFLTEEGNIASSFKSPEKKKVRTHESASKTREEPLENCTEFIFNGELYVQMPKRVFEGERERLKAECERMKESLLDLRAKIDEMLQ